MVIFFFFNVLAKSPWFHLLRFEILDMRLRLKNAASLFQEL
jgi:hypothetical protein